MVTVEGDNVVELKNLAVLKEEQGKGYGKRMIEYVCKFYSENTVCYLLGQEMLMLR